MTIPSPKKYKIDRSIKIDRKVPSGTLAFKDIFVGFDKVEAVRQIFGERTDEQLSKLKVEVFPREGFMGVSDEDGHIFASQYYIRDGAMWSVYLDIVHELVHVRQFFEGKQLFDPAFAYVDRPTEIEAYQVGAMEARRIGMTELEIFEYLEVPWISKAEHLRLAKACNVLLDELALNRDNAKTAGSTKK